MRRQSPLYAAMAAFSALWPTPLLAQENGGLFSVDLGLSIWTIVVFLLLLWLLGRFAWGPILGALDERERRIQGSIDEANRLREEAQRLLEEHQAKVAQANKEAQEILNEARQAGERMKKEMEESAREEGERIVKRARWEIGLEKERVLDEIQKESVDLILTVASKLMREKLDAEADKELVLRYLEELAPARDEATAEAEA